ncbi:MAG: MBL fold metallo-hydrolase [Campylobacterales bacterium]|nr:MBL fold metallo-hydrolase [Campylobacterales bacterium]
MTLTILFDNIPYDSRLKPLWGFSCLVQTPQQTTLFDTGSNGRVLLEHMRLLGIEPCTIDTLVLSHHHWDHTGGIDSIMELNPKLHLIVPTSLSKRWINDLKSQCRTLSVCDVQYQKLGHGLATTGVMRTGDTPEQALMIETPDGVVLLTGCAHAGIVAVAQRAIEMSGREIVLLIGGFHLIDQTSAELEAVIEELSQMPIHCFCPTHCSGPEAIALFERRLGSRWIRAGVGAIIEV